MSSKDLDRISENQGLEIWTIIWHLLKAQADQNNHHKAACNRQISHSGLLWMYHGTPSNPKDIEKLKKKRKKENKSHHNKKFIMYFFFFSVVISHDMWPILLEHGADGTLLRRHGLHTPCREELAQPTTEMSDSSSVQEYHCASCEGL